MIHKKDAKDADPEAFPTLEEARRQVFKEMNVCFNCEGSKGYPVMLNDTICLGCVGDFP